MDSQDCCAQMIQSYGNPKSLSHSAFQKGFVTVCPPPMHSFHRFVLTLYVSGRVVPHF